ncbi:hypothetical protein QBC46DRAFT_396026 [Diplogelasinospora grovesii]|uniref:Uncharacterized protein n=1 Tax=Diplogelasinospora grovesii TaxID=303347 RepID=A0AAN6S104_9PEZI|nr:hypothetical protein QBC46DRAFT_396026 [Diplogelasinospora grovesii]
MMRSHPYTPPPPLPPILGEIADELAAILPNQQENPAAAGARRHSDAAGVELCDLDPVTSRLLPPPAPTRRKKHHHVRVQGKLVLVRSISTHNLRPPLGSPQLQERRTSSNSPPVTPLPTQLDRPTTARPVTRYKSAVGSTALPIPRHRRPRGRRRGRASLDDGRQGGEDDGDATETDEEEQQQQQRETVIRDTQLRGYGIGGAGNIRRPTEVIQFSSRGPSSPASPTGPDKKRWNIREMLGLPGDRRGKGSTTA